MLTNDDRLEILLLGRPLIRLGDHELAESPPLKSQALLFYLAVTGRPVSREALATLLWGEMPNETARTNLRLALSRLRKVIGDCLIVDRHTVTFAGRPATWVDANVFAQIVSGRTSQTADALRMATNLVRGAFLDDFCVLDAPEFETWVITEREWFHQLMLAGLQQLLTSDRAAGRTHDAINVARRMLQVAPWHEEAHQELMELLALTGQRSAALAQYELCRRLLDEELRVPPSAKTDALRARIAANALCANDPHCDGDTVTLLPIAPELPEPEPERVRNAPQYPDPLLGRAADIARVRAVLEDPACRLLTLVGPGGIGKTRLALAAADGHVARFVDGACFIPFAGIAPAQPENCTDLVINGIANALGYTFDAQHDPHIILLNHLANKHLLLICDNFEHLQAAATLLEEVVLAAPGVQLVVTSRKRLGVKHEWLYDVTGLAYAADGENGRCACAYPAEALFARCAQKVKADFDPVAEADHIHKICRVLEGWPLSIELAANWLRLLPCTTIAARLQDDVILLDAATGAPDDRHRSMRAVLEASWALLSADEQRVCSGIACFRGGFELSAAQAVVRASLVQLGSLVDKSLLRCDGHDRYHMHEQVRQFAGARLGAEPAALATTHRRHTAYYAALAAARPTPAGSVPDTVCVALFDRELENLRLAFGHALGDNDVTWVASLLENLLPYFRFKGWNREIVTAMEQACAMHSVPLALQARWQRWWADALYQMGDLHACHQKVEELMCLVGEPIPVSMPGRYWFLLREFGRQLLHRAFPRITFGRGKAQCALIVEIVRALERYGQAGYLLNQPSEFLIGATNINHAEHAGATEFLASGYATLALLLANLGIGRAAKYYRQLALHFVQQDTNTAHRAHALEMIGFSFFVNSDFQNTERFMWQASILAEQAARRRFSLENQLLIAQSNGIQGNYHTQLRLGQLVFARAREFGDVVVQTWALLTQIEVCLHIDRDPTVRVLPLLRQAQAQPSNKLNRAEHFGIHSNLAVVALRTGDSVRAASDLDQAIAYVNSMALPANGAFESYANLSEVATALTALPDISPADQRIHNHRSDQAYVILRKFSRAHRFALPRKLIFEGILNWQHGRRKKAFKNWQKAAALAPKFGARYDTARAHFEIGRHLAPQQTWEGQDAEYYLTQARSEFADIGAGYMLSQVERHFPVHNCGNSCPLVK